MSVQIDTIRDLLQNAFEKVFKTMLSISTEPAEVERDKRSEMITGSVGITGDVNGIVYIFIKESFGKQIACQMLELTESELEGNEMVNDVIGEISNMVVGITKTNICDLGFDCSLTIPSIIRGRNYRASSSSSSESRSFSMKCGDEMVRVELITRVQRKG